MKRNILAILFAFLTVFSVGVVFFAATHYGLCVEDDYDYLLDSKFVTWGFSLTGLKMAFTFVGDSIWMPLTWMSYMLDHAAGWGAAGAHAVNIALHALNSCILLAFLIRLFSIRKTSVMLLAWLATLTWALHPLRVESVVWLASRKDEISTLFVLVGLFFWVSGNKPSRIIAALCCLVLAAMGKPSAMIFPVFALPLDFLVTRQRKPNWAYVAVIIISLSIAIEGSVVQGVALKMNSDIPLGYRIVNAVAALSIYIGNTVCPSDLAVQCTIRYPSPPRHSMQGFLLLALIGWRMVVLALPRIKELLRTRKPDCLFDGTPLDRLELACGAMFLASLVPFIGLVGFGYHAFADRFTLLPQVAVSVFLVGLAVEFVRNRMAVAVAALAGVCIVGLLSRQTMHQVTFWKNDGTLFEHTLAVDGDANVTAHRAAGIYYWNSAHDVEKVHAHLKKAIDISYSTCGFTDMFSCCHLLIDAAYALGYDTEAEDYYFLMAKWNHTLGCDAMEFLMAEGIYYANQRGQMEKAEKNLERLQRTHPDLYDTRYLAYYLACKRGNAEEIANALEKCPLDDGEDSYNRNDWARKMLKNRRQNSAGGLEKWYTVE